MPRAVRPLGCVLLLVLGVIVAAGATQVQRLRLPSAADEIRARIRAEQLLRGGRGPERTLPGPVTDTEVVRVAVTPRGVPHRVTVDQRLRIEDIGDFFIKIPGPVQEATALPDSTAQPGLRSGSLVWQGFASRAETLGARVELDPQRETDRLPVDVRLRVLVDGRPSDLNDNAGGSMDLEVEVRNSTAATMLLPSATLSEPESAARVLDSVGTALVSGKRPRRGRDFPATMPVVTPLERERAQVTAPLSATLIVSLDEQARAINGRGIRVTRGRSRTLVTASAVLSARNRRHVFRLSALVPAGHPSVGLRIVPSAPPPSEARPPVGKSWAGAFRRGAVTGEEMLARLVSTLAEVARLPDVDAYLGNPDRDGPSRTAYSYRFVGPAIADEPREAPTPRGTSSSLLGIGAAAAITAFFILGLVVWWALS